MKPNIIPADKIIERLRFENPWWRTGTIDDSLDNMQRRLYFDLFFSLVEKVSLKRALILMGPRRVGKTVMMYHVIQALLNQNVPSTSIIFISIDNPVYISMGLEELFLLAAEASGSTRIDGRFVFFDEIQYLKDWERHLKVLVDSYPNTKFIASGSAAAALKVKSSESGAGRFHDFMLPPLTFQEYLHLLQLNHLVQATQVSYLGKEIPFYKAIDVKELNRQFISYLNFGGYPEVLFSELIKNDMSGFIKNDIIDKVLLRDLPSIYGIKDVRELNRFFTYLVYHTGKEFSLQKMAKESGLKKEEIRRYMIYLESAFLINVVYKVDENARHFRRVTSFKIYLTNPSLRTALFSPVEASDDEMGNMVETAIYAQWMHRENVRLHYAKWKVGRKEGEVDMVMLDDGKLEAKWAVEIKWTNRYVKKPKELKSLLNFCKTNGLPRAVVTAIDKQAQLLVDGIELYFYPASLYAYVIGANTLSTKKT